MTKREVGGVNANCLALFYHPPDPPWGPPTERRDALHNNNHNAKVANPLFNFAPLSAFNGCLSPVLVVVVAGWVGVCVFIFPLTDAQVCEARVAIAFVKGIKFLKKGPASGAGNTTV